MDTLAKAGNLYGVEIGGEGKEEKSKNLKEG